MQFSKGPLQENRQTLEEVTQHVNHSRGKTFQKDTYFSKEKLTSDEHWSPLCFTVKSRTIK